MWPFILEIIAWCLPIRIWGSILASAITGGVLLALTANEYIAMPAAIIVLIAGFFWWKKKDS